MNLLITKQKIYILLQLFLRPNGKFSFLNKIPKNSKILDIGCGNNSAFKIKTFLPNSYYVGIDICDCNNDNDVNIFADEYILTEPKKFVDCINSLSDKFDAVISSHNLEHCNDRYGTLNAMIDKLKNRGKLYLSFPSEETIKFPKRNGCLNYFDDSTHKDYPPNYSSILKILKNNSLNILFSTQFYKPFLLNRIGFFTNIISYFTKNVLVGVWEWWGFESIIVAQKFMK